MAKYVLVAVVLAVVLYQQFVLWQLKKKGAAPASFFRGQAALMREITRRALAGSPAAQLHHAAMLGVLLWIVVGLGYNLLKQS